MQRNFGFLLGGPKQIHEIFYFLRTLPLTLQGMPNLDCIRRLDSPKQTVQKLDQCRFPRLRLAFGHLCLPPHAWCYWVVGDYRVMLPFNQNQNHLFISESESINAGAAPPLINPTVCFLLLYLLFETMN